MGEVKGKVKFLLWIHQSTKDLGVRNFKRDRCRSQSQFIERAIQYYAGHIEADDDTSYLPNAFLSNMKSILGESDNRYNRMLFRLSVEMAILSNLIAASQDIDKTTLSKLRDECAKEVRRLNGSFTIEDAVEWQQ